jgi:precorrin-2 dehydrogenase / sirohydrochlorin ferrochelatase
MDSNKSFMPIAINVKDKKILLIGGGKVALHKIESLQNYANNLFVIAREVDPSIKLINIKYKEKEYQKEDLNKSLLVYACTNNRSLNEQIRKDCIEAGILVNVVDNPGLCDFVSPAIHKHSNISIAVSSNGQNVYSSIGIRNHIRKFFQENETTWEFDKEKALKFQNE